MFDARYHALSLVAVFVALVIGLLLGVAIGDQGLVSGAERELREDLREDVESARGDTRAMRAELDRRRRYESQTYAAVVGDRLAGRRVAVITMHQPEPAIFDRVRDAVTPAGGDVVFVGRLRLPPDLDALSDALAGTRFEDLEAPPDLLEVFGRRLGSQIVSGGELAREVRQQVFASSSGELDGAEAVVLIHGEPPPDRPAQAAERTQAFVSGLIDGLRTFDTPVAGVEQTDTDPSQIGWYRDRGVTSVDNVDEVPGRAALALVLAGGGSGAYGVKPTAEALLPEALVRER